MNIPYGYNQLTGYYNVNVQSTSGSFLGQYAQAQQMNISPPMTNQKPSEPESSNKILLLEEEL